MSDNVVQREEDIARRIKERAARFVTTSGDSPHDAIHKGGNNITFGTLDSRAVAAIDERVSNQINLESNPSLSRALDILAGLIVCPNGGSTVTLTYSAEVEGAEDKYKKGALEVCKILDNFFTSEFKLQNQLYKMVHETLTDAGSFVTAFIPDSNIDSMLATAGLEDANKEIARLSNSLASDDKNPKSSGNLISVVHDTDVLKLRDIREATFNMKMSSKAGLESEKVKKSMEGLDILRKRRQYKKNPILRINPSHDDKEINRPMVMQLSSESVSPLIFKSDPDEPFGYLVILDGDGYPVATTEEIDFDKDLRRMNDSGGSKESNFQRIANNFTTKKEKFTSINDLYNEFCSYLEHDVYNTLIDGSYTEKYTVDDDALLSKIAFHRILKNQKTHILYLPASQVNYFAFDRDRLGVGRSLVSRTKALSNIFTVLFYANFMGTLSNAIPRSRATIDFDNDDFDKGKRAEEVVSKLIETQVNNFDFNYRGPKQLMKKLSQYGLEFRFNNVEEGDLPNMNVTVEDVKRDIRPIDMTYMQEVGKLISHRVGFSQSVIDDSYSPKFSSEVIRDNDMTARQISSFVGMTTDNTSDYVVKYTINDPVLMSRCLEALGGKEEAKELLHEILANLTVSTPTTEMNGLEANTDLVRDVVTAVNSIVDVLYPSSYIEGIDNASAAEMRYFQDTLKAHLLEDYLRRNSAFKSMIDEVIDLDRVEGLFDSAGERKVGLMKIFANYHKDVKRADDRIMALNAKNGNPEQPAEPTTEPNNTPPEDDNAPQLTPPPEDDESEDDDAGNAPQVTPPPEDDESEEPKSGAPEIDDEEVVFTLPPL